jgi:hypothetical protein
MTFSIAATDMETCIQTAKRSEGKTAIGFGLGSTHNITKRFQEVCQLACPLSCVMLGSDEETDIIALNRRPPQYIKVISALHQMPQKHLQK